MSFKQTLSFVCAAYLVKVVALSLSFFLANSIKSFFYFSPCHTETTTFSVSNFSFLQLKVSTSALASILQNFEKWANPGHFLFIFFFSNAY